MQFKVWFHCSSFSAVLFQHIQTLLLFSGKNQNWNKNPTTKIGLRNVQSNTEFNCKREKWPGTVLLLCSTQTHHHLPGLSWCYFPLKVSYFKLRIYPNKEVPQGGWFLNPLQHPDLMSENWGTPPSPGECCLLWQMDLLTFCLCYLMDFTVQWNFISHCLVCK